MTDGQVLDSNSADLQSCFLVSPRGLFGYNNGSLALGPPISEFNAVTYKKPIYTQDYTYPVDPALAGSSNKSDLLFNILVSGMFDVDSHNVVNACADLSISASSTCPSSWRTPTGVYR